MNSSALSDKQAEQALLSCLLLEPECLEQVRDQIFPQDFCVSSHQFLDKTRKKWNL